MNAQGDILLNKTTVFHQTCGEEIEISEVIMFSKHIFHCGFPSWTVGFNVVPAQLRICLITVESGAEIIPTLHSLGEHLGLALNLVKQELVYQCWVHL